MNLKKLIFAGMLSSLLLGMTGCSTSKPAEQESSQAQTQETYEKVSSIDQLIELVKSKYTENSNEICLYTVRVPITVPGYDNDQLITRVVYTKQDGTITDKLLAADHSNFLSLKDPAISYDIDIKQERFLCDQFYDSHSVISLLENDVGGRETRNYYEPLIRMFSNNILWMFQKICQSMNLLKFLPTYMKRANFLRWKTFNSPSAMPLSIGSIPMPIMKKKNIKWLIRQRNLTITVFILKKYH